MYWDQFDGNTNSQSIKLYTFYWIECIGMKNTEFMRDSGSTERKWTKHVSNSGRTRQFTSTFFPLQVTQIFKTRPQWPNFDEAGVNRTVVNKMFLELLIGEGLIAEGWRTWKLRTLLKSFLINDFDQTVEEVVRTEQGQSIDFIQMKTIVIIQKHRKGPFSTFISFSFEMGEN